MLRLALLRCAHGVSSSYAPAIALWSEGQGKVVERDADSIMDWQSTVIA
jgi:hypothetical protein